MATLMEAEVEALSMLLDMMGEERDHGDPVKASAYQAYHRLATDDREWMNILVDFLHDNLTEEEASRVWGKMEELYQQAADD